MITAAEGAELPYIITEDGTILPDYYQADFCLDGDTDTVTMVGSRSGGVPIPDSLLRQGQNIKAYLVVSGSEGEDDVQTRWEITIPVNERPVRSGMEIGSDQAAQIDSLMAALNAGVLRSETAAGKAEDAVSHYPKIVDSYWHVWDAETADWVNTGVKAQGVDGIDGVSPTLTVTEITGGHRITITDKNGTTTVDVMDGEDGDGRDGYSPTVTVTEITGGHRVTITDKNGDHVFDVMDGDPATNLVTSVAGKTGAVTLGGGDVSYDDTETYESGTVGAELSDLNRHLNDKQDKTNYVTLSGTIITQTGVDNTMYLCGELAELTFTAPASGQTAIRFSTGTTATVASFPGVTWLNGFDPNTLETERMYEINILNLVGVASWT